MNIDADELKRRLKAHMDTIGARDPMWAAGMNWAIRIVEQMEQERIRQKEQAKLDRKAEKRGELPAVAAS